MKGGVYRMLTKKTHEDNKYEKRKKNGRLAGFVVYGITGDGGFLL